MKKNLKQKIVFTLSGAATLALASAFVFVGNNVRVSAQTETPIEITVGTDGIVSAGFYMEDGAGVRIKENEAGIRFTTNVTDDFVAYLAENYVGYTVQYGTLITGVNMLPENGTVKDVTHELMKEDGKTPACKDTLGTLSEMAAGKAQYYGSVLYNAENGTDWNALTTAQKLAVNSAEVIARAYVKVSKGEDVQYLYAQADDTARSMRAVANVGLMGEYAGNTLLQQYIAANPVRNTEEGGYYDESAQQGTIAVANVADGTYTAYVDAKKIGEATVSEGKLTLSALSGLEAGKTYSLNLFDENAKVYSTPFVNPTKILKTAADLNALKLGNVLGETATAKHDGYYVLGNDIDATEYKGAVGNASKTGTLTLKGVGLTGTFNGFGHKIYNLGFASDTEEGTAATAVSAATLKGLDYSLFGVISGGTVKNVAFVNVNFENVNNGENQAERATLASYIQDGATLENVYVQVDGLHYGAPTYWSHTAGVAYRITDDVKMTNVVVEVYDDGTIDEWGTTKNTGTGVYTQGAGFGALSVLEASAANVSGRDWNNVFVIAPFAATHTRAGDTAHNEWYGENLGVTEAKYANNVYSYAEIKQYTSSAALIKENVDFTALGFTADKGWNIVKGYAPSWNGLTLKSTYTVDLDKEKTALSENDLTALFGNKEATLVSAKSLDSAYTLSYAGGALSVQYNGGTPAYNGETFQAELSNGTTTLQVTVRLCTNVIETAAELAVFNLGNTVSTTATAPTKTITGYYTLGNNIDADVSKTNYVHETHGYVGEVIANVDSYGFRGTFDGRGYAISNLTLGDTSADKPACGQAIYKYFTYSLFGVLGNGATVKNFALQNLNFDLKVADMTMSYCTSIATLIGSATTMENVYVKIGNISFASAAKWQYLGGIAFEIATHGIGSVKTPATMNNVVVDATAFDAVVANGWNTRELGSLACRHTNENASGVSRTDYTLVEYTNVYVVAAMEIVNTTATGNVGPANSEFANKYAGVERYESALPTTEGKYSSFDNEYWDLTSGAPVWRA